MPVMEILNTHTEGQLIIMAISSHIQYEKMKKDIDSKEDKDYSIDDITVDNVIRPPKPFKEMTSEEIEAFYRQAGA